MRKSFIKCLVSVFALAAVLTAGFGLKADAKDTAMVSTADVYMRSGPAKTFEIIGTLPANKDVTSSDMDGGWYYVDYAGKTGWCWGEYLKVKGSGSESNTGSESESEALTMYTTCGLNLRQSDDNASAVLTVIPANTELKVTAAKYGWYRTTYNGKDGYCYGTYLSPTKNSSTASQPKAETPKTNDPTGNTTYMYALCDLNIRSGPAKENSILSSIPKNERAVCTKNQDGWYYVTYNGVTGWASGQYLSNSKGGAAVVAPNGAYKATMTTTGAVYMRSGPAKSYASVLVVPENVSVSVTETQDGWYKATYNNQTGWISGRFLK